MRRMERLFPCGASVFLPDNAPVSGILGAAKYLSRRRSLGSAWIFPGQGSQAVGMGRDLYDQFPASRAVFEEADEVLGFALSRLCFEGPAEALTATGGAQLCHGAAACSPARRANGGGNGRNDGGDHRARHGSAGSGLR